MTEMIQRVAREIYYADCKLRLIEPDSYDEASNLPRSGEVFREKWETLARAAILALREPTGDMMMAGADVHPATDDTSKTAYGIAVNDAADVFIAMLDKALES